MGCLHSKQATAEVGQDDTPPNLVSPRKSAGAKLVSVVHGSQTRRVNLFDMAAAKAPIKSVLPELVREMGLSEQAGGALRLFTCSPQMTQPCSGLHFALKAGGNETYHRTAQPVIFEEAENTVGFVYARCTLGVNLVLYMLDPGQEFELRGAKNL
eukprot:TRINITY_DN14426_c0_g1_i2.p1 TRINITY_DN14426_c0_g1~~TRINITY_DN14426_c0_g1_i2.p1  ORF type:complete len:155 (+),score=34.16 TRINITY_DN14426_c0_g1_i2:240-704(+)